MVFLSGPTSTKDNLLGESAKHELPGRVKPDLDSHCGAGEYTLVCTSSFYHYNGYHKYSGLPWWITIPSHFNTPVRTTCVITFDHCTILSLWWTSTVITRVSVVLFCIWLLGYWSCVVVVTTLLNGDTSWQRTSLAHSLRPLSYG